MEKKKEIEQNLRELYNDIVKAAEGIEVSYNSEAVWKVLNAYDEFFAKSAVSFRTTTKSVEKRDLAVRYVEVNKTHDPFAIALEKGLLVPQGHPIEKIIPELQARYPRMAYGVDMAVSHGLEKIWPFLKAAIPLEEILTLSSLPPAIKYYVPHFEKYGFETVELIAVDFWNRSLNLYFHSGGNPKLYTPERLATLLGELGLSVPSQEELELDTKALCAYYTFTWESDRVERVCFVMAAPQEFVPVHLHPIMAQFAHNVPFRVEPHIFFFNPTYPASASNYIKIEADYRGLMGPALKQGFEISAGTADGYNLPEV